MDKMVVSLGLFIVSSRHAVAVSSVAILPRFHLSFFQIPDPESKQQLPLNAEMHLSASQPSFQDTIRFTVRQTWLGFHRR